MNGHHPEPGTAIAAGPGPVTDLPPPDADVRPAIPGPPPYLPSDADAGSVPIDRVAMLTAAACFLAGFTVVLTLVA